jgi:hypothetical protein
VTCLDGVGKITIDGVEHILKEGESIVMPAKHPHAVYGREQFKMLLVVVFLQPIILRTFRTTQTALLTQPTFGICHLAIFNTNTHRENGFSCFSFNTSAVSTSIIVRCKEKTIEIQKEINRFFICMIIIFAIYQPIAALKIFSLFFINLSTAC